MAEVTAKAYEDLRQYIVDTWQYIELQDDSGTAIVRLSPDDSRVSWVHEKVEVETGFEYDRLGNKIPITETMLPNTLQLQIVITGSDSEITLPQTFAKSVLFNVDVDGDPLSTESFEIFEMVQAEDEITVTHNVEVPQVTA